MPSSPLRLFCVVEGEKPQAVFPIDVLVQDDVADLKKKVQIERTWSILRNVDPHTLELWKV